MARSEARLSVEIWKDPDFLARSPMAQRMYMFLLSQPDLAHDGVIPLRERRWSKSAAGMSTADIGRDLQELAEHRFVVVDLDSEEVLIRSFIRRDKVYRQPNVLRAAADHLAAVESPAILHALAVELARIEAGLADEERVPTDTPRIVAEMRAALPDPSFEPPPNPSGKGSGNPSTEPSAAPTVPAPEPTMAHTQSPVTVTSPNGISAGNKGSGNPSGKTSRNPPGERGELLTVSEVKAPPVFPDSPDLVPPPAGAKSAATNGQPPTAQTIIGEWLDRCRKRPPKSVIGRVGKSVRELLGEGIEPDDVRRGIAAWMAKGSDPTSLPSFVNQAMNARPAQPNNVIHVREYNGAMLSERTIARLEDNARFAAMDAAEAAGTRPAIEGTAQ